MRLNTAQKSGTLNCLLHKQSLTRVSYFYRRNKFLRPQMDFMDIHISQSTIIQIFKLQFTQTHRQQLKQSTDDPFDQKSQQTVKNDFFVKIHLLSKDSSFDHWMIIIHQGKIKNQQNPKIQN